MFIKNSEQYVICIVLLFVFYRTETAEFGFFNRVRKQVFLRFDAEMYDKQAAIRIIRRSHCHVIRALLQLRRLLTE